MTIRRSYVGIIRGAMSALAKAGPDCDPCGGPLNVIVKRKKKSTKVFVYKREFGLKIKIFNFLFLCIYFQSSNQTYRLILTLRRLMSYIYMEHPFLMFLDHTQRRSTVGGTPLDE